MNRNLNDQAKSHLNRALVFDPSNAVVRQGLHHRQINGTWYSEEQIRDIRLALERRRVNLKAWVPTIQKVLQLVSAKSSSQQSKGWSLLAEINEPESVAAIEEILLPQLEKIAEKALAKIAEFETTEPTKIILRQAIFHSSPKCRDLAANMLNSRERHDYVPELISQLQTPTQGRFAMRRDATGQILCQIAFGSQTLEKDIVRQFDAQVIPLSGGDPVAAVMAQRALEEQVQRAEQDIARHNEAVNAKNGYIQSILEKATGENPGSNPEAWWNWWYDYNEVYVESRELDYSRDVQTYYAYTEGAPRREPVAPSSDSFSMRGQQRGRSFECLAAGTLVWTDRGSKPVESVRTGDRVLTQNIQSGQREYRVVLSPTVRPETPTLRLMLEGDIIRSSGGHAFWVIDQGWVKARHLRPGMRLATADSSARIESIEDAGSIPFYNLIVDGNSNFFVGKHRTLSHDNSIINRAQLAKANQ